MAQQRTVPDSRQLAPTAERQLYKITEAAVILGLSRSVLYEQMRMTRPDGRPRLRSVKQGRTRLIPAAAIREYVALLEHEAEVADDRAA
ncbi:helix-turn-helix domain-containing protein [Amycolatopsis sp. NPDC051758]|uniref:helix-turn-helix domain-containing protein n=1 Tax=Amycolatopsis sp. NPDC051758 TaxID=3363935 RepID=UPI0037A3EA42